MKVSKDQIANINKAFKPNLNILGTSRVQEQRKGQVMIHIAITLGLNCNKLEHHRALISWGGTCGQRCKFLEDFSMHNSCKSYGESFCYHLRLQTKQQNQQLSQPTIENIAENYASSYETFMETRRKFLQLQVSAIDEAF